MNEPTLAQVRTELEEALKGQKFGKIFPLGKLRLAIDLRLPGGLYLLIGVEPTAPRIHLVRRRLKELEKASGGQPSFVSFLRKRLAHAVLEGIEKIEDERVLILKFLARNEFGENVRYALAVQLTGRSSNLFLLDERGFILDSLRDTFGEGQEPAGRYAPPARDPAAERPPPGEVFPRGDHETLSEALDAHYLEKERAQRFRSASQAAKGGLSKELKKKRRLVKKLEADRRGHGDPEDWKKRGDLLLANVGTAERTANGFRVTDYFEENAPSVEIEAPENLSVTEAAELCFKRYAKARNAAREIAARVEDARREIEKLEKQMETLERAIADKDLERIESFAGRKEKTIGKRRKQRPETSVPYKEYLSSDGFEILVGKRSKDNDYLTFRVARSLDTWLHAADYPGSHVIIRNPDRKEIPHRTLVEAAQLAAFHSKARNETKVGVHHTQKKYVNKPKGAAPGLVSMSSFKTILVEPRPLAQKDGG